MSTPGEIGAAHRMGASPLTPDEMRSLLRECVTVVKPGETLVLRLGPSYTPRYMQELQIMANSMHEDGYPRVMVVPADELGVVESSGD